MSMILFYEDGRLGNQLFQYCAVRLYQPRGKLIALGMKDLTENFVGLDVETDTLVGVFVRRIMKLMGEKKIGFLARKLRLLTLVEEQRSEAGVGFKVSKGLIPHIAYFKGYYQSEEVTSSAVAELIDIREEHKLRARELLAARGGSAYFVHVRRGDYVRWPSPDAPAVLPFEWYSAQMQCIRERDREAWFVVVSDDKPYVEELFGHRSDVLVICQDPISDFSMMAECLGGGILSASSFSWWAAYFVRRSNPDAHFLAPEYWIGHRPRQWFPGGLETSWLQYRTVHHAR